MEPHQYLWVSEGRVSRGWNRQKLMHRKFHLNLRKWPQAITSGNRLTRDVDWRYLGTIWMQFPAMCSRMALLEQGSWTHCGPFYLYAFHDAVTCRNISWHCRYISPVFVIGLETVVGPTMSGVWQCDNLTAAYHTIWALALQQFESKVSWCYHRISQVGRDL